MDEKRKNPGDEQDGPEKPGDHEFDANVERVVETLSKCDSVPDGRARYHELVALRKALSSEETANFLLGVLTAIGNRDRFWILSVLKEKDRCVCELEAFLGKSQSTVSHHLRVLENHDLVRGWKRGKFTHYALVRPTFEKFKATLLEWMEGATNWTGGGTGTESARGNFL
ncbi:MAG: ArsR/SmtB family transcription factor [Promethearchaeota archaeon]